MTAPPQIIERTLTVKFAQSVHTTVMGAVQADLMEVAVIPLDDASSNAAGATFAGGLKSATVELSDPLNVVSFNLVPTYSPGLTQPINYRILWRAGVQSRTFTYDFAMPDQDISFDQLASLNFIIDGTTYLQQTDLGKPGRVARLNAQGQVIDASGTPVAGSVDISQLNNLIVTERNARSNADQQLRTTLEGELNQQVSSVADTAQTYTNNKVSGLTSDIGVERGSRITADNDLQNQLNLAKTSLQAAVDALNSSVVTNTNKLTTKADLVSGKIPVAQIPEEILTNAFPAVDQAAMLALPAGPTGVHKGSVAIRPDGVYLLTTNDPTQLGNWVSLTTVNSVNNKRGVVNLTAGDVGAIPAGGSISQNQVTGLATALNNKADNTALQQAIASITAIQNDPTLVHTTQGVIPSALLSSDMVYINNVGQLVKKDGSIIPITGGQGAVFSVQGKTGLVVLTAADVNAIPVGGAIGQGQVTGLATALSGKASQAAVDAVTTALTTKADLVSGLLPLSQVPQLPVGQILNLTSLISNNQLTQSSNAVNRIASLESQVASGGGGNGGGGISSQAEFWTSANTTTPVTNLTQVNLHSPWGVDSDGTITGTTGTWYYLYTGVRSQDAATAVITANGHLQLRKVNEANPADPVYATQPDFLALQATVGQKANQTDLTALTATVGTKATTAQVSTLSSLVDSKAAQADLAATNVAVQQKASATDLANLTTTVNLKANQSALDSTNTAVAAKADTTALTAVTTRVSTVENTLPSKADLNAGVIPVGQVPNLPQSKITGLSTTLGLKADLSGGTVPVAQLPTNIPIGSIAGLGTSLGAKADLINGVVPLSQIPAGALPNVVVVANRAAMLALTLTQVQYGDLVLISGPADKGTYVLTGNDPSIFSNWTALTTPDAPVTGVWKANVGNNTSGFATGNVTLVAADVGALDASSVLPISQVDTLLTRLASADATTSFVNGPSGLATKAALTTVQNMFYTSSMVKRADYVANPGAVNLAGQQPVDGVNLVPNQSVVLVTNQADSKQNGLWVVSAGGSWVRPADYATSSLIARNTIVIVANSSSGAPGVSNNYSIWQMTGASATIDQSGTSWTRIAGAAPQFVPSGSNGVAVSGSAFSAVAAPTVPNPTGGTMAGGLTVSSTGIAIDPNSGVRKIQANVPTGSTLATITHGLNNPQPSVTIWDTTAKTMVLAGVTAPDANSISIEFKTAPSVAGQYRVTVLG